jgi:hypothetical protein
MQVDARKTLTNDAMYIQILDNAETLVKKHNQT